MSSHGLEKTRNRILEAACRLLEERGGKDVRMADIAEAAGLSRQAVYLHFRNRTDLMVAAVQHGDRVRDVAALAGPWNAAAGSAKLDAWVEFWGGYIPRIYGIAKALMLARDSDEAAAAAWDDRMTAVHDCCRETIAELAHAGVLADDWSVDTASDALWMMGSFSGWEQLTLVRGWTTEEYIERLRTLARRAFLRRAGRSA